MDPEMKKDISDSVRVKNLATYMADQRGVEIEAELWPLFHAYAAKTGFYIPEIYKALNITVWEFFERHEIVSTFFYKHMLNYYARGGIIQGVSGEI